MTDLPALIVDPNQLSSDSNFNTTNCFEVRQLSSQATKDIVRKNFTRELEFFDFCKQQLHKQYLALNLDAAQP